MRILKKKKKLSELNTYKYNVLRSKYIQLLRINKTFYVSFEIYTTFYVLFEITDSMFNLEFEAIPSKKSWVTKESSCVLAVCVTRSNPLLQALQIKPQSQQKTKIIAKLFESSLCLQILKEISTRHTNIHVLICDHISVFERLISSGMSEQKALRLDTEESEQVAKYLEEVIQTLKSLPVGANANVTVEKWSEMIKKHPEYYQNTLKAILDCNSDENTATLLKDTATFYIKRRNPNITINENRISLFSQYIQHEMIVQLYGLPIKSANDSEEKIERNNARVIYHPVSIPKSMDSTSYTSPILDVKSNLKSQLVRTNGSSKDEFAHTLRIYIKKEEEE